MFAQLPSGHTVAFDGAFICLEDSGKGRSITNAAEEVIQLPLPPTASTLTDTWDQLPTRDGRFAGFKSLGATRDLETAKARASVPIS